MPNLLKKALIAVLRVWEAAIEAVPSAIAREMGRGVSCVSLEVVVERQASTDLRLRLRYHFRATKSARSGTLFFDALRSPLAVRSVTSGSDSGKRKAWDEPPDFFAVDPAADSWDGEVVEVVASWECRHGSHCLAIPGSVPRPVLTREDEWRPPISVSLDRAVEVAVVGLSVDSARSGSDSALFEAGLILNPAFSDPQMVLSRALADELGDGVEEFATRVAQGLESMGRIMGVPSDVRCGWGADDQPWIGGVRSGVLYTVGRDTSELMFGFQLAGVWWGGGCRIRGRQWREVEWALRIFTSLLWIENSASWALEAAIQRASELSETDLAESVSTLVLSKWNPRRMGRVALTLYAAHHAGDGVLLALRAILRDAWGATVDARAVVSRLREEGVEIWDV